MSFLHRTKESSTPVIVHLVDGLQASGVIKYYDNDVIKLERTSGPSLLIRKTDIRYVSEMPGRST